MNQFFQEENNQKKAIKYAIIISIFLLIVVIVVFILHRVPQWQVSQFRITNQTDIAKLENDYRATLAQIIGGLIGGIGLLYGIYMTVQNMKISNETQVISDARNYSNMENSQKIMEISNEVQLTSNLTRAIDQLVAIDNIGNPAIEIRLGGIYTLERISNISEESYWPIMDLLTAYVRKNSSVEREVGKVSFDIQAILDVIGRRRYFFMRGETVGLNLINTNLQFTDLSGANLSGADFKGSNLSEAKLEEAKLEGAYLEEANLKEADLTEADLIGANLERANLEGANLEGANLEEAYLLRANLKEANLKGANLEEAYLIGVNLEMAKNLTPDQLSKVKTLYNSKLDEDLCKDLENKYPDEYKALIKEPD